MARRTAKPDTSASRALVRGGRRNARRKIHRREREREVDRESGTKYERTEGAAKTATTKEETWMGRGAKVSEEAGDVRFFRRKGLRLFIAC
jgi:hypothetical protein